MRLSSPVETNPLEATKEKKRKTKKIAPRFLHVLVGLGWRWKGSHRPNGILPAHINKSQSVSLPNRVHDRAAPTILIPEAAGRVMPSEGRKKKMPLSLFFCSAESFLWLPPPSPLPSVTSKCQPAWETPGDLRSAGREALKTYTIKFFLPFTLMSYWKARWHFAIMQRTQLRSLVRWNVIHKYVMPGIYWCFAAASASSRSSQGLFCFFFSFGVSTREEMRRTLTKQWSVIIIISSTACSLAQGMWKFMRPHSPYLWEMINCASLHVADWRLPLLFATLRELSSRLSRVS